MGGAIGDALGFPVEFMRLDEIKREYGENGIQDLVLESGFAKISDDTQMTLFTAEGLLRAETRLAEKGITTHVGVTRFAYLRWLYTQGYPRITELDWIYDGYLLNQKELFHRRAPGNSCLDALKSGKIGTVDDPINNSKGCGGVMRMAPAGLLFRQEEAFEMGKELAALTHGHPTGYNAAGAFAVIIAAIIEGKKIEDAVMDAAGRLRNSCGSVETSIKLIRAMDLAKESISDIDAIHQLGEGWIAEEALAIGVFCAIRYEKDFCKGIAAAVNHGGDSDSTGSIAGNILGAYLGVFAIPDKWQQKVELNKVICQVSDDLLLEMLKGRDIWERWPGY